MDRRSTWYSAFVPIKVAVITGGSSGLALASAKRFVEEGAFVFITGRRQEALDEAVKLIDRNVTGVRGDLDRLFDTVEREKGRIDVLYSSAGMGEPAPLGEITEQHFDATFVRASWRWSSADRRKWLIGGSQRVHRRATSAPNESLTTAPFSQTHFNQVPKEERYASGRILGKYFGSAESRWLA